MASTWAFSMSSFSLTKFRIRHDSIFRTSSQEKPLLTR